MKGSDRHICIPTYSGVIEIGSKNTEKINILTKILLQGIKLGLSVEKIRNIIKLPINLLEEDLSRLEKVKIIYKENGVLKLTEIGEKNYNIIKLIEEFNKKKLEVILDRYSSLIFLRGDIKMYYDTFDDLYHKLKTMKSLYKLETGKFVEQLYYNNNPQNSRKIIMPILRVTCEKLGIEITEELMEDIYVKVDLSNKREGFIVSKTRENMKDIYRSELRRDIPIERPYFEGKMKLEFDILKNIKLELLMTLEKIKKEDKNLLSEKAINLIVRSELSQKNYNCFYDPIKNNLIDSLPDGIKENEKKIYKYPFSFNKNQILIENDEVKDLKLKFGDEVNIFKESTEHKLIEKYAAEEVLEFYEEVLKNELHKFEETV